MALLAFVCLAALRAASTAAFSFRRLDCCWQAEVSRSLSWLASSQEIPIHRTTVAIFLAYALTTFTVSSGGR